MLDASGSCGVVMQNSFTFSLMGSAALAFLYFWRRGRLDMDESPKMQMFEPDHDGTQEEEHER